MGMINKQNGNSLCYCNIAVIGTVWIIKGGEGEDNKNPEATVNAQLEMQELKAL